MSFNVGRIEHPSIGTWQIEISNDKEFLSRLKEINKELKKKGVKEPEKMWKVSRIGEGRVPADIARLMNGPALPPEKILETTPESSMESAAALDGEPVKTTTGQKPKTNRRIV